MLTWVGSPRQHRQYKRDHGGYIDGHATVTEPGDEIIERVLAQGLDGLGMRNDGRHQGAPALVIRKVSRGVEEAGDAPRGRENHLLSVREGEQC